ncbi:peptide deformylase [Ochrobactrum sp. GPK 3]|uniref:peptide deformylase n=1 Tax=Brucella sp. 22210 TaxID=3453892 RepID=UPI0031385436
MINNNTFISVFRIYFYRNLYLDFLFKVIITVQKFYYNAFKHRQKHIKCSGKQRSAYGLGIVVSAAVVGLCGSACAGTPVAPTHGSEFVSMEKGDNGHLREGDMKTSAEPRAQSKSNASEDTPASTKNPYAKTNDPVLRKVARDIDPHDIGSSAIQNVIDELLNDADKEPMIAGLAAPQIGHSLQIIAINDQVFSATKPKIDPTQKKTFRVFINPKITSSSHETMTDLEGCYSVPGLAGIVERAKKITVSAYDREGKPITIEVDGYIARVFQHEIDHLNGLMYPDRIFRDKADAHDLHYLHDADASPKVQTQKLNAYREQIRDWIAKHHALTGFSWPQTISKSKWEGAISEHKPDWHNDPMPHGDK